MALVAVCGNFSAALGTGKSLSFVRAFLRVPMSLFELRTPRDMLEKARREHQRLVERFDIDNLFNFFVTAYHISDYVQKTGVVAQVVLDKFLQDQDIKDCRDLCDKGKHLTLTKRPDPTTHVWSGCIGGAPIGVLPIGGGDKWVLFTGDREVDVEWLAERVLAKWEAFFSTYGCEFCTSCGAIGACG